MYVYKKTVANWVVFQYCKWDVGLNNHKKIAAQPSKNEQHPNKFKSLNKIFLYWLLLNNTDEIYFKVLLVDSLNCVIFISFSQQEN